MIEYTWIIVQMEAHPTYFDHDNVVFNVHWTLRAEDGAFQASVYGSQSLNVETIDEDTFTSYEDLTQAQVVEWLEESMGDERVDELKESLEREIENQRTPTVVTPPLPWGQLPD